MNNAEDETLVELTANITESFPAVDMGFVNWAISDGPVNVFHNSQITK